MATWAEVRQWKPDDVGQVGDHLAAQNKQVIGLEYELADAKPVGWTGEAAEAAANDFRARRQELEELAARLQRYGEEWAREFATAHERNPSSHHIPVGMDLHNNEVGRNIAQANPDASPEELANLVEQAVKDGKMVVIDKNDTLVSSNELNPGETREIKNNAWPTDNPGRNDDHDPGEPSATPDQY